MADVPAPLKPVCEQGDCHDCRQARIITRLTECLHRANVRGETYAKLLRAGIDERTSFVAWRLAVLDALSHLEVSDDSHR